jgi:hypothetical protein
MHALLLVPLWDHSGKKLFGGVPNNLRQGIGQWQVTEANVKPQVA